MSLSYASKHRKGKKDPQWRHWGKHSHRLSDEWRGFEPKADTWLVWIAYIASGLTTSSPLNSDHNVKWIQPISFRKRRTAGRLQSYTNFPWGNQGSLPETRVEAHHAFSGESGQGRSSDERNVQLKLLGRTLWSDGATEIATNHCLILAEQDEHRSRGGVAKLDHHWGSRVWVHGWKPSQAGHLILE